MSSEESSKPPKSARPASVASDKVEYAVAELKPMAQQEQPEQKVEINPAVLGEVQEPSESVEPDVKKIPDKLVKLPAGNRRMATVVNMKRVDLGLPAEGEPSSEAPSDEIDVDVDAGEPGDALSTDEVAESIPPRKRRFGVVVVGLVTLAGAAIVAMALMKRGSAESSAAASPPKGPSTASAATASVASEPVPPPVTATAEAQVDVAPVASSVASEPLAEQGSAQASQSAVALASSVPSVFAAPSAARTSAPPRAAAPRPRAPAPKAGAGAGKPYNPTDI